MDITQQTFTFSTFDNHVIFKSIQIIRDGYHHLFGCEFLCKKRKKNLFDSNNLKVRFQELTFSMTSIVQLYSIPLNEK